MAALFRIAAAKGLFKEPMSTSIDATGLENHHVSRHYLARTGRTGQYRRWHKLVIICDNDSHLIPAVAVAYGPGHDSPYLPDALTSALEIVPISCLLADSGFDSEANHRLCREQLKIDSIIPVNHRRSRRGVCTGTYRKMMEKDFPKELYSQRSQVENVFSRIKRRLGSHLRARLNDSRKVECLMRVLTFNLLIILCAYKNSDKATMKAA